RRDLGRVHVSPESGDDRVFGHRICGANSPGAGQCESPAGRCGGLVFAGVTPSATRRPKPQTSRRTGRAPPGAFGDGIVQRQPTARCPLAHTAVSKRYTSPGVLRSKPKKHRARDAVETADLRLVSKLQVRFAAGPPRRREVPGSVGPSRPQASRAPSDSFFERTEGK